ncbi:MAG: hypothetical protein A2152_00795 [Candidatus Levybacteria bacterium RBG_16_35_6]|nr:MAG: hypothetical protein A2152_00795 [Candidatus Levybacteria bacterium RBG_16_35_6]
MTTKVERLFKSGRRRVLKVMPPGYAMLTNPQIGSIDEPVAYSITDNEDHTRIDPLYGQPGQPGEEPTILKPGEEHLIRLRMKHGTQAIRITHEK